MKERSVGIRELKSKHSEYIRDVKTGRSIVVTERGRRVARIVPETHSLQERLAELKNSGAILWSGRRLRAVMPMVRAHGKRSVADIVIENRE